MSIWLILVIAIPILFIIGTTYNAIKEQKRLENGKLKEILKQRAQEKQKALEAQKNNKGK